MRRRPLGMRAPIRPRTLRAIARRAGFCQWPFDATAHSDLAPNLSGSRPLARTARQCSDLRANLAFSETQLVELLQVHPELRTGAEPMPKTQRRVGGDSALAMNDARDAIYGHIDLARQFRSADAKLAQFFGKMFAGVNGGTRHDHIPSPTSGLFRLRPAQFRPVLQPLANLALEAAI